MKEQQDILAQAKSVLLKNRRNGFTIPTAKLYPFQWDWDSAFISLGYAAFNIDYVIEEFQTLFSGQWSNGMIPHILFHDITETTYFPSYQFWNSAVSVYAPKDIPTSGISQPPVHGFILERILQKHPSNEKFKRFLKWIFPKLVKQQAFYYNFRDPNKEGLFFLYHPWESGRDNSPIWDRALSNIPLDRAVIPPYQRRDILIADPAERPTQRQYDCYVYLLELGKKYGYSGHEIAEESPLMIQDVMSNAILIRSNEALISLGNQLNEDVGQLQEWQQQSITRFREKLWHEESGIFASYDMRTNEQIPAIENGAFVSLYGGMATDDQAERIHQKLVDMAEQYFLCPSYSPDTAIFDPIRYWRGPIWPHMNWMIYQGLRRHSFDNTAEKLRKDTMHLIEKLGFYEYFDPRKATFEATNKGYGGNYFSWTASTYIDFLTNA